jgi:hypothetical protein
VNVYFVSAGEVTDYGREWEPPETYVLCDLVAADTRSQARYELWRTETWVLGDLHEQRWTETQLIVKDVDRERGRLKFNDPLWKLACPEHPGKPCVCEILGEGPPWQCDECGGFDGVAEIEFSTTPGATGRRLCGKCFL